MGLKKNNPGCNCCGGGGASCTIGSDNFDRSDSGSLGSDWTEDSGSWSIASNKLYTASTSAKATYQTAHPDSEVELCIKVDIDFDADGDKARLFLGNDVVIELEGQSTTKYVRIYEDGTKTYDEASSIPWANDLQVYAIYSSEKQLISVRLLSLTTEECHLLQASDTWTGYSVALGTGDTNTAGIQFDIFRFYKAESTANPTCVATCIKCENGCEVTTVPIEFNFPSSGSSTPSTCDCSVLNGTVYYLTQGGWDASTRSWVADRECSWGTSFDFACVDSLGNPVDTTTCKIDAVWTAGVSYYYWVVNVYFESGITYKGMYSGGYDPGIAFDCDDANLIGDLALISGLPCLYQATPAPTFEINP